MMSKYLKVEFLKEKKSANLKLIKFIPLVFVVFNLLMNMLMTKDMSGRSYLMATSFNWYPLIILPVLVSLIAININNKEKNYHEDLYKRIGADWRRMYLAKAILAALELLIILLISGLAIYLVGKFVLSEKILLKEVLIGNLYLYVGSLVLLGFSFLLSKLLNKSILIILFNFILSLIAPIIAIKDIWIFYPWSYSLRMLAPIVKIHPNGTFLEENSFLLNMNDAYLGLALSLMVFLIFIGMGALIERRKNA